jgi:hypothetical protein
LASGVPYGAIPEHTLLPNGKQVEKWEGLAIGPRLQRGAHLLLIGSAQRQPMQRLNRRSDAE